MIPSSQHQFENTWKSCKKQLREDLSPMEFRQWIEPLEAEISENTGEVVIHVKNRYQLEFIRKNYIKKINSILCGERGNQFKAELNIRRKAAPRKPVTVPATTPAGKTPEKRPAEKPGTSDPRKKLRSDYTFETFVEGSSNGVAHSAGLYVADEAGNQFNPLYIYGGVGLGKTHLLNAIGNRFIKNRPERNIIFINTENFISDISRAARHRTFPQLQKFYQQADLLLIDDVQNFSTREKSQEEFFNLFNFLISKESRIVMSSDTYPKQLDGIPERLRSRFSSGITVEIEPPQLEMRMNILHSKAQLQSVNLTDDVAFFIAEKITSNVRELEGAFNNVLAYANFNNCEINIETARKSLRNQISHINRQISVESIQKTVADYYRVELSDIYSGRKTANIVKARHIAMYLSKKMTRKSLQEIGKAFGGKDHSTVIHAHKKIEKIIKEDNTVKREIKILEQTLNA